MKDTSPFIRPYNLIRTLTNHKRHKTNHTFVHNDKENKKNKKQMKRHQIALTRQFWLCRTPLFPRMFLFQFLSKLNYSNVPIKLRTYSFRQGLFHSKKLSRLKVMARKSQQAPAGTVLDIRTV